MAIAVPAENPLFPPEYDWAWNALIWLITILMMTALVDVMRLRRATLLKALEWVALIVVVPIIGPTIWFLYGRNRFVEE
jgi:uncharacterized membrane protein YhaH (DUF805 family)